MEVDWNSIIGEAITQGLRIMLPVCVALILKWAGDLWLKIKDNHPDMYWVLNSAAEIGFAAAEEYFRGQTGEGESKLDYAIEHAQDYIESVHGVKVDLNLIKDAIIQYGVEHRLFSWQELPKGDDDE